MIRRSEPRAHGEPPRGRFPPDDGHQAGTAEHDDGDEDAGRSSRSRPTPASDAIHASAIVTPARPDQTGEEPHLHRRPTTSARTLSCEVQACPRPSGPRPSARRRRRGRRRCEPRMAQVGEDAEPDPRPARPHQYHRGISISSITRRGRRSEPGEEVGATAWNRWYVSRSSASTMTSAGAGPSSSASATARLSATTGLGAIARSWS